MYEKVNPSHPDKIADRIGGAIVDLAYSKQEDPKIAVEVLIGHGRCHIITETSVHLLWEEVSEIVERIAGAGIYCVDYDEHAQDRHLAMNQAGCFRCGDNGIFKGVPVTEEQRKLTEIAKSIYDKYGTDGKYIIDGDNLIICQSHAKTADLEREYPNAIINPLGDWTGGTDVDTGATNRKLGSDMGDSITGGGTNAKDLSKADVSVNIWVHMIAQQTGKVVEAVCHIGDTTVSFTIDGKRDSVPFEGCVYAAKQYIRNVGGFEKFAEWGLIR